MEIGSLAISGGIVIAACYFSWKGMQREKRKTALVKSLEEARRIADGTIFPLASTHTKIFEDEDIKIEIMCVPVLNAKSKVTNKRDS